MHNFLQNIFDKLTTDFSAKTNVAEWFNLQLKTHLSKNITLEDWNTLQVYIKNNVSDIQSLRDCFDELVHILDNIYISKNGGTMTGDLKMKDNKIIFEENGKIAQSINNNLNEYTFPKESGELALNKNIPTKTSQLENDSGYVVEGLLSRYMTRDTTQTVSGNKIFEKPIYFWNESTYIQKPRGVEALEFYISDNLALSITKNRLNVYGTIGTESSYVSGIFGTNIKGKVIYQNNKQVANKEDIPTKVSQLENDSGLITNAVDDLTNYYLKSETYTKSEVQQLLSTISGLKLEVVTNLPTTNISSNTIYLKPLNSAKENNIYEEYIYINNKWETIGTTAVDLSNYALKTEIPTKISQLEQDVELGVSEEDVMEIVEKNAEQTDTLDVGTSATFNPESDKQIPTSKAVAGLMASAGGEGGGSASSPLKIYVEEGTTEQHIEPNKYYIFRTQVAPELTLTFAEDSEIYLDEFMGEIQVDETPINVTLPTNIRWNENEQVAHTDTGFILANKYTYIFSVVNGLGLITSFENPTLDTPTLTITDSTLSWTAVENAESYDVYNGDTLLINTTLTSFDLSTYLTEPATYTIKVFAKSSSYTDSTATTVYIIYTQLATPTNLVLSDTNQLTWDSVENASGYIVTLVETGTTSSVTTNLCDLPTAFTELSTAGTYTFTVKAWSNIINYNNSEPSTLISVTIA